MWWIIGVKHLSTFSFVIPVFNEVDIVESNLIKLQWLRDEGHQLILSDGGSKDGTCKVSESLVDHIVVGEPGRALQMNKGASIASGQFILFLHIDTQLCKATLEEINNKLTISSFKWGRVNVRLSGNKFAFRIIEYFMNLRSCISGIATGDQMIFIEKDTFDFVGGFPEIALMEDIEMSTRLKKVSNPLCIKTPVITSSRRWENNGIIKTVVLMWSLRLMYFFGVSPHHLARLYS